jgi:hypothetical protein
MRMRAFFWMSALTACSGFSVESKLRESGAAPYVRCLAAPADGDQSGQLGNLSFELRSRVLTLRPKRWPLRIGAFSAPGFGPPPTAAEIQRLRASEAELFVMLGGLGADEPSAIASARMLADLGPLLLLLGGRDTWAASRRALEGLEGRSGIMDGTALRKVVIGNDTLVTVSGAEHGRYAVSADACGFGRKDLELAAQELGPGSVSERRWLLSWQAAAGMGALPAAAQTEAGLDLGSYELARFAQRIGARGALSAWPAGRAERPLTAQLGAASTALTARVVPRGYGPGAERPDGSRTTPGVLLLELDDQGLRVVR